MSKFNDNDNYKILMKNNQLISKTRYNITTIENRIFQMLLYKLQRSSKDTYSCTISHDEFRSFIKNNNQATIKAITATLTNLRKQSIYIKTVKKNSEIIWGQFGFINGFLYDEELNLFTIKASDEIYSMLKNYLGSGYTPVNLFLYLKLNNSYAQRLYELLRLWTNSKKVITYSVKDLKELMMIENKYTLYGDFKRRVIKASVSELNSTGIFQIDIKENKIGKRVDSIDFIVDDLDKRKYFEKDVVEIVPINNISPNDIPEIKSENIEEIFICRGEEFYIPNRKLFTPKTIDMFTLDFKNYDFKVNSLKKLFYESVGITLEKNNCTKIYIKSYNYFKKVLQSKLGDSCDFNKKVDTSNIHKTKFHNCVTRCYLKSVA